MLLVATALANTVLTTEVAHVQGAVASLEASSCGLILDGVFQRLAAIDPAHVDRVDVAQNEEALARDTFQARLDLGTVLVQLHREGTVDDACITGARRVDLATRYLLDHLYLHSPARDPWLVTPGFTGLDDLRSGDVLVTRGKGLSSAGIAHIGRIDSQFSHNAMVHVDADGKRWTVEAYLERGALVQPLETFLEHGLGRIAVMRYENADIAAQAAKLGFERIRDGAPIDYDEAFDHTDAGEQLFCSEIAPWTFAQVGGPADVPLHKTVFPQAENAPMFTAMGVTSDIITAPVDLLFDPRFSLVGEWRDVEALESMRRHDAVVEALYRWMEEEHYELDQSWRQRATVDVGLTLRRTPLLGRFLADKVHPHGDRQFLVAGLALQDAGNALERQFRKALAHEERPSLERMRAVLEQIRIDDRAVWEKRPRKATVHRVLHP